MVSQLEKTTEGRVVRDSQVSTLLMSYELIKELEKHANDKNELRNLIRNLVSEILDDDTEINEMNTTANAEGYQTRMRLQVLMRKKLLTRKKLNHVQKYLITRQPKMKKIIR